MLGLIAYGALLVLFLLVLPAADRAKARRASVINEDR